MSKLSPQKRNHLILVGVGTLGLVAILWFYVIRAQQDSLVEARKKTAEAHDKVDKANHAIKRTEEVNDSLQKRQEELAALESQLAPEENLYGWFLPILNKFSRSRPVAVIEAPKGKVDEVHVLPRFPYKGAVFSQVRVTGFYHDIGRFLADFENDFPYFQIQNPDITLTKTLSVADDREKLDFTFDIVALVQPGRNAK